MDMGWCGWMLDRDGRGGCGMLSGGVGARSMRGERVEGFAGVFRGACARGFGMREER